ncbi:MAG: hypothetical protein LC792_20655, partial [Actinobacteria bacterium]|nr:hypothetical protein [Actinomycetota bacterium]
MALTGQLGTGTSQLANIELGVAGATAYTYSLVDPLGLTDVRTGATAMARVLTDAEGVTDVAARSVGAARSTTDPLGSVDAVVAV